MKISLPYIVLRSLIYNRTQFIYQALIVVFLAAVITGSLLTGYSVRTSLLERNKSKLNGTGIVVSSGKRYLPSSITNRLYEKLNVECEGLIEFDGWVRNFSTGESALNTQVFGVENSFFSFDGSDSRITIEPGQVIINQKLAQKLELSTGDDIILRIGTASAIPADSPFAPEEDPYESFVLTITEILSENVSDFSLGINQVIPMNLFLSLDEFSGLFNGERKINRILIKENALLSIDSVRQSLYSIFTPEDAGLEIRSVEQGRITEIISERIFLSENELSEIAKAIPSSRPVITYLANSLSLNEKSSPYSFISGIHEDIESQIPGTEGIIINRWLADDLDADNGDTIKVDYFVMGSFKEMLEKSAYFRVERIIETESLLTDPYLMPEFPGIAGSESCSRWDAGVPINFDDIREKDEEYWNLHHGTPKAIINYSTGRRLWGNEFGPATALRFSEELKKEDILSRLKGNIDPFKTGITIIPVRKNTIEAAENSVDFSTLFLSLGFFIIISGIILLILLVSTHFETRYSQIRAFRSLGFSNNRIVKIVLLEASVIAFTASILGVLAGTLFDDLIIGALNSVWTGAVQTETLSSHTSLGSLLSGFLVSIIVIMGTISILLSRSLKIVSSTKIRLEEGLFAKRINFLLFFTGLATFIMISIASLNKNTSTMFWFASGAILFIFLLVFVRYILKFIPRRQKKKRPYETNYSWSYFGKYPSRALTPIIFLAAGLFIVIVTGANRKSFKLNDFEKEGGTGGFLAWAETATPLFYDMNSERGKQEYNLVDPGLNELYYHQIQKADGDDASCLNLNQVNTPPILGIDGSYLSENKAFSFATKIEGHSDPWQSISKEAINNTFYGVADQTVLQWSLFIKVGDTLKFTAESGESINIIIAGGLTSSIFQGHVLIGKGNFRKFYPSISGSSIFLTEGDPEKAESSNDALQQILEQYGIDIQSTSVRLAGFYEVTNTYLDVFLTLGGIGMIMGVIGMGFVLLRNFTLRKQEYALLMATGYSQSKIRNSIIKEHMLILSTGVFIAIISAPLATFPSLMSEAQIPYLLILLIIALVYITGALAIIISINRLINDSLIQNLRKE